MKYWIVALACLLAGWAVNGLVELAAPRSERTSRQVELDVDDANRIMEFVNTAETNLDELRTHLKDLVTGNEAYLESVPHVVALMDDHTTLVDKAKKQCKVVRENARALLRGDESESAQSAVSIGVAKLIVYSRQSDELSQSLTEMLTAETSKLQNQLSVKRQKDAEAMIEHIDEMQQKIEVARASISGAIERMRPSLGSNSRLAQAVAEYELSGIVFNQRCTAIRLVAQQIVDGNTSDEAADELSAQHSGFSDALRHCTEVAETLAIEMERASR